MFFLKIIKLHKILISRKISCHIKRFIELFLLKIKKFCYSREIIQKSCNNIRHKKKTIKVFKAPQY